MCVTTKIHRDWWGKRTKDLEIPQRFRRLVGSYGLTKNIPTFCLEQEKTAWEQMLTEAHNGNFENSKEIIVDATEELTHFRAELLRR